MHIKKIDDKMEFCFTSWCGKTVGGMESGYVNVDAALKSMKTLGVNANVCIDCLRSVSSCISLYYITNQERAVQESRNENP